MPSNTSSQSHSATRLFATVLLFLATGASQAQAPFLPAAQLTDEALNELVDPEFFQITSDGQFVVFLSTQNSTQELFSVPFSEGSVLRLSPDLVSGGNVAVDNAVARPVSPFQLTRDGLRVVYVADQTTDGVFELFAVSVMGGPPTRLNGELPSGGSVAATSSNTDFRISPNDQWVVYIADQNEDDVFELFSVPIQGGTPVRLNAELESFGSDVVGFQISFDSQQVVYLADQNNNDTFELFSVPITGGSAVRLNADLTSSGDVNAFQINQMSNQVVYLADQNVFGDDELFSVPITGGTPIRLNDNLAVSGAANSSDVVEFEIADNQDRVVFLADSIVNDRFELFSVPILGGTQIRLSGDLVDGGNVRFGQFATAGADRDVVYVADQNADGQFELFSVPVNGGEVVQLSPPNSNISSDSFIADLPDNIFSISTFGENVVFLTDYTGTSGTLYSVPTVGGTPVRLDTAAPGDIRDNFQISADEQDVLFTTQTTPSNLFRIPIDGGTADQLNGELAFPGSVENFVVSNDSQRVIYLANQASAARFDLFAFGDLPPPAAAVLPGSRSVQVGETATAFATLINTTSETLLNCSIGRPALLPFSTNSFYQATDPSTNGVVGFPNSPVDIAPGAVQTFVFGFVANTAFAPLELAIPFDCSNTTTAASIAGVNTLLLSGSDTPVADVVALGATPTGDGILTLPGATGAAAFAVASVNVGSAATVTVSPDTGDATVPLALFICETNPLDGQCLSPPSTTVETSVANNATPTFSVFANASGDVAFDPANTRIRVRFLEAGQVRGSTSVAVRTQ